MHREPLSPTERCLMRACWDLGREATHTEIHDQFVAGFPDLSDYRSIGVLIRRCVAKGYLASRSPGSRRTLYWPTVERVDVAREELTRLLEQLGETQAVLQAMLAILRERAPSEAPSSQP